MSWTSYRHDGQTYRLVTARDQRGVWIAWPGGSTYIERASRRATGAGHDDGIRAPMTGKIVKVLVRPSDAVAAGDVLVILEAMKMEYRLTAPHAGVVEKVFCAEGELVDLGKTLIALAE